MKIQKLMLLMAAATSLAFVGCSDDDDINPKDVPQTVDQSFNQMFPNTRNVEWDKVAPYYVADFTYNTFDTEAWYKPDGQWAMTETDYNSNIYNLPEAIQTAFLNSEYATWIVDDVDYYQRPTDEFAAIEVESQGNTVDVTVFFDSFGNVINVVPGYEPNITPSTIISGL